MAEEKSQRHQQIEANRARVAPVMQAQRAKPVRVVPKNDTIRKYLRHHPSGIRFPASGSVEWPMDNFTRRRIADGDVTVEGGEQRATPKTAST